MSNVDPRLELARQIAANRRPQPIAPIAPTSGGPVLRRGLNPETLSLSNKVEDQTTTLLRRFPTLSDKIAAVQENKPIGGFKGNLAKFLSNPLVKPVFNALSVLDVPRRVVISAGREMVDLLDSDPNTKASISDFKNQVKDASFGFGTAFPMKGNWGRFAGFVGDVGLDPLTYATLGASGAVGLGERTALASRYLDRFGDAAKAATIVQRGKAALDAAEIAELGLKRSGVYFFGEKIRLPFSGPLGDALLSGVTRARIGFTNTRFGEVMQKAFMGMGSNPNQMFRDVRLALARGEQMPKNIPVDFAIKFVNGENLRRSAANIAFNEAMVKIGESVDSLGRENMQQFKNVAYKWLEGTATPSPGTVEEQFAGKFKTIFDELWDNVDSKFKEITPDATVGRQREYFPWYMTQEAKQATTDLENPWVKGLMSTLEPNPLDPTGSFRSRGLKEGAEFLWTVDEQGKKIPYILKAEDLNITRLNEISKGALGIDFFETDLEKVLMGYARSYSEQMGLGELYKELANTGFFRQMQLRNVVDTEAVASLSASADAAVKNLVNGLKSSSKQLRETFDSATKIAENELKLQREGVVAATESLQQAADRTAPQFTGVLEEQVSAAKQSIVGAKNEIESLRGQLDFLFHEDIPAPVAAMYDDYERLVGQVSELEKKADELLTSRAELSSEAALGAPAKYADLNELKANMDNLANELDLVARNHELYSEMNSVIAERFDDLLDGRAPRSVEMRRVRAIAEGTERKLPAREGAVSKIDDFSENVGAFKTWAGGKNSPLTQEPWFQRTMNNLTGKIFNKTRVAGMSHEAALHAATNSGVGFADAVEMVNASAYMLARDLKFYGADVPPQLAAVRQRLLDSLDTVSVQVGIVERAGQMKASDAAIKTLANEVDTLTSRLGELESMKRLSDDLSHIVEVFGPRNGTDILLDADYSAFIPAEIEDLLIRANGDMSTVDDLRNAAASALDSINKYEVEISRGRKVGVDKVDSLTEELSRRQAELSRKVNSGLPSELRPYHEKRMLDLRRVMGPNDIENVSTLANSLMAYTLVSESQRRFISLGKELAQYGLTPTDDMYALVIRRVGQQQLERSLTREKNLATVAEIFGNIRNAVTSSLVKDDAWASKFDNLLEAAYSGEHGDAVESIMGNILQYHSDAVKLVAKYKNLKSTARKEFLADAADFYNRFWKDISPDSGGVLSPAEAKKIYNSGFVPTHVKPILRGIADGELKVSESKSSEIMAEVSRLLEADVATRDRLSDFIQNELKPWFKQTYGEKYSDAALKREAKNFPTRSKSNMRSFFNELLGGHYRSGASYEEKIGRLGKSSRGGKNAMIHKSPSGEYIAQMVEGRLTAESNTVRKQISVLNNISDPSLDVRQFLNDPFGVQSGPLSQADFLDSLSKQLERDIEYISTHKKDIVAAERLADKAGVAKAKAERELSARTPRLESVVDPKTGKIRPETASEFRTRIAEATADMSPQRIQDEALLRNVKKAHDELRSSPQYVDAKRTENITNMILGLRSVDGWKAVHPKTGESGWFIDPSNPYTTFQGILGNITDPKLHSEFVSLSNDMSLMREVQPPQWVGGVDFDFVDNNVFIVDPRRSSAIPATAENVSSLDEYFTGIKRQVMGRFRESNGELSAADQRLLDEVNDWTTGKWKYYRFDNASLDSTETFNVDDLVFTAGDVGGATSSGIPASLTLTSARDKNPFIFEPYYSRKATFVTPTSLAERKAIADSLRASNAINEEAYMRLLENDSIDTVLNSTLSDGLTVSSHIQDKSVLAQLRRSEEPLSFTEAEWKSLYSPEWTPADFSKAKRNITTLETRSEFLKKALRDGKTTLTQDGRRFGISAELKRIDEELSAARSAYEAARPSNRSAALEKASQLFRQLESTVGPRMRKKDFEDKISSLVSSYRGASRVSDKTVLAARKSAVEASWKKTRQYAVLQAEKDLMRSPELTAFRESKTALENMRRAARDAAREATRVREPILKQEQNVVSILETSMRIASEFKPETREVLKKVIETYDNIVRETPEGAKSIDIEQLRRSIPADVRRAAKEIRTDYVSPAERTFVEAVTGTPGRGVDLYGATYRHGFASMLYNNSSSALANEQRTLAGVEAELAGLTGKKGSLTTARKEMDAAGKKVVKEMTRLDKTFQKRVSEVMKKLEIAQGSMGESLAGMAVAQSELDNILPNLAKAEETVQYMNDFVQPKIKTLEELLGRMQAVGGIKGKYTPEQYRDVLDVVEDFKTTMNNLGIEPDDALNRVYADLSNAQASYMITVNAANEVRNAQAIGNAQFVNLEQVLSEGYATLERFGLNNMEAPQEVVDLFDNVRRMKDPAFQRSVMNFIRKYTTTYFKPYATLSPGFHVRNAMSNTFALIAAGANPKTMFEGLQMYKSLRDAIRNGMGFDAWVATLPEAKRGIADIAGRSMFASGGGQVAEAFRGSGAKSAGIAGKFEDNFALRTSHKVGAQLESSARFMLGYDSAVKGLDLNSSAARVRRFLIDYEDVGAADEAIRTIIPFWMWTSRNLPLHLTNQWMNPRPYAIYNSFKRNFTAPNEEGDIVPSWIVEQGGFKIAKNTYLLPDLGFNRMGQQVAELGDPIRLLSQVNPLLRLPIELAGGRKLYNNQPFSGKPMEVSGGVAALLQPLLQIAGYGQTTPEGKQFVDEKALYAVQSLLPFLAQGERLLPSTSSGQEKQGQALMGYLGIPIKQVTEGQKRGELYRQLQQLQQLATEQKAMYGG